MLKLICVLVAQLDRVDASDALGRQFESAQGHHIR